ncbi:hypothetical protein HBH69_056930 [Parastagonospora nodorum]|nr:hypothetical protein HBH69_056930 [Parastagonospora nodorum]KAH5329678.1 hypothetical protein HBI12_068580 [Parastagonospora nodorum]KAH5707423.1 hypothetical protein HBI20_205170 [Parastagonospora nodorum]KAH6203763.1 hypothetical protein HBI43_206590 [Parastagonospora nodorum]KAH6244320.1 hypothetical protein HBI42_206270 [Parastagonospora nodorum]
MIIQDVSKRYIYLADLKALLLRLFPNDNCEIEETPLGYYKCTVPEEVKDVGGYL